MHQKSRPLSCSLLIAALLVACEEAPPPPIADNESELPSQQIGGIDGFKFLRLGMTLEELKRLRSGDFNGGRDADCLEDQQVFVCRIERMTIADQPANVQAKFFAQTIPAPANLVPMPAIYQPSMQEVRLGNAAGENSKQARSIVARREAIATNIELELRRLAAFQLAMISVEVPADSADPVRQALIDRYGTPVKDPATETDVWMAGNGSMMFSADYQHGKVDFLFQPIVPALEAHSEKRRRQRAGDL